jgi:hypothetical protein
VFTNQGIAVDSWVSVDGQCWLSCDVIGDQAQFDFGHSTGSLHLNVSEAALARLVQVATEALTRFQAIPDGEEVCFSVTAAAIGRDGQAQSC